MRASELVVAFETRKEPDEVEAKADVIILIRLDGVNSAGSMAASRVRRREGVAEGPGSTGRCVFSSVSNEVGR
jgi:hypothetical protein